MKYLDAVWARWYNTCEANIKYLRLQEEEEEDRNLRPCRKDTSQQMLARVLAAESSYCYS